MKKIIDNPIVLKKLISDSLEACRKVGEDMLNMGNSEVDIEEVYNHYTQSQDYKESGELHHNSLYERYRAAVRQDYLTLINNIDENTDIEDYCKQSLTQLISEIIPQNNPNQRLSLLHTLAKVIGKEGSQAVINMDESELLYGAQLKIDNGTIDAKTKTIFKRANFLMNSGQILNRIVFDEVALAAKSDRDKFNNFVLFLYLQDTLSTNIEFYKHLVRRVPEHLAVKHCLLNTKIRLLDNCKIVFNRLTGQLYNGNGHEERGAKSEEEFDNFLDNLEKAASTGENFKEAFNCDYFKEGHQGLNQKFVSFDFRQIYDYLVLAYFTSLDKQMALEGKKAKSEIIDIFPDFLTYEISLKSFNEIHDNLKSYYPATLVCVDFKKTLNSAIEFKDNLIDKKKDSYCALIDTIQENLNPLIQKKELELVITHSSLNALKPGFKSKEVKI